jgi:NADH-ubiquinone oxidoreductase chain 2
MLVLGIFSLMIAVALQKISPLLLIRVTSIILFYAAALSFNAMDIQAIGSGLGIYSGLFQVTSVSQAIDVFIYSIAALILLPWAPTSVKVKGMTLPSIPEYSLIILFTVCGATFLVSSADLVSMYLSIELQSFAVYILAALYRDSESATSAGLKYFLLGGLSSGLILLGSALVYAYTGLTSFEGIYTLLSVSSYDDITGPVTIGLTITVVGFLFKVAAAPFHNWAPDVYDGTPTIVTTWLTIMPKISILVFLLELQSGLSGTSLVLQLGSEGLGSSINIWKNLLLISSLLSLVIGTVVGLAQFRIKRLFAYSTISHVGFLLLALAINSEESIESFVFYLVQYSITNLNAFLILLAFGYIIYSNNNMKTSTGTDIQFISELKGQFKANPLLGLALATCLFSMAGIPPLMGFFAKQMVLYSATHSGYYFMSFVAIVVSVISAAYYLRIVRVIHFDASSEEVQSAEANSSSAATSLTNVHSFTIALLTLAIALFVFKPTIILNSTHLLALTLFNA